MSARPHVLESRIVNCRLVVLGLGGFVSLELYHLHGSSCFVDHHQHSVLTGSIEPDIDRFIDLQNMYISESEEFNRWVFLGFPFTVFVYLYLDVVCMY